MVKYILAVAFFLTNFSFANQFMFGSPVSANVTGASTRFMTQNNLRSYLIIVNKSGSTVYAKFGSAQTLVGEGIPIPAGGNYEPFNAPSNSVYLETITPAIAGVVLMQGQ